MMLWPQACPTPGSASYSAHSATTSGPFPARAENAVGSSQIPDSTSKPLLLSASASRSRA